MNFQQKLDAIVKKNNSLLCIGLDPDLEKLPPHILKSDEPIFEFNKKIIDLTADLVCGYKPNSAFYESQGINGIEQLKKTIDYIHNRYTGIPVILDAKRSDVGNTSEHYAKHVFDYLQVDAVTINPYLGFDAIEPFLKRKEKGVIILCRTSNLGAKDFQDLIIENKPLYIHVAKKIVEWNNQYGNCLMVVGATWPEELRKIRDLTPSMTFLVPGIGTQNGDLKKTLEQGFTKAKTGLIISSSRSIIYASRDENFAKKARMEAEKIKEAINFYRK